jgi:hypothetical protein
MTNNDIAVLISELKQLRVREARVIDTLETLLHEQRATAAEGGCTTSTTTADSSAVTPAPVLYTNTNANSGTGLPAQRQTVSTSYERSFRVGDSIVIINKVKRPLYRPVNRGDRVGIITKITKQQIWIRTVNGDDTWRLAKNIRHNDE